MKKILLVVFCGVLAVVCGCQTRITATKNPETAVPIYAAAKDGAPYIRGYQVLSGGWEATARSPLWADEAIKGLSIGVATNGTVTLSIDDYSRDLSTNAVTMAHNLVSDFALLAEKAAAAYATLHPQGRQRGQREGHLREWSLHVLGRPCDRDLSQLF